MSDDTAEALRQQQALDDAFYKTLRTKVARIRNWDQIVAAIELGLMDANIPSTAFVMTSILGMDVSRACMGLDQQ